MPKTREISTFHGWIEHEDEPRHWVCVDCDLESVTDKHGHRLYARLGCVTSEEPPCRPRYGEPDDMPDHPSVGAADDEYDRRRDDALTERR